MRGREENLEDIFFVGFFQAQLDSWREVEREGRRSVGGREVVEVEKEVVE